MAKYFDKNTLALLAQASEEIVAIRNRLVKLTSVDLLDTDAISALSIYEIVSQYDPEFNVNFARNGEDAKSGDKKIENKATRVQGPLTRTGKLRKGSGMDAAFQFHAMGDLDHERYVFVARDKDTLAIVRLYDISSDPNRKIVLDHLMSERQAWLDRSQGDQSKMKRDIIVLPEKLIQEKLNLHTRLEINGCVILKD